MLIRNGRKGLKPGLVCTLSGTAEAVPFQKQFLSSACLLLLLTLGCALCAAQSSSGGGIMDAKPKADIIFEHANIYTGVPANAQFSSILREEAIAVRGDRIQAVGKMADMEKLKGPQTQVVDLGGHFVMPGFNDAHLHLDDAGKTKLSVDLTGVKSLDELRTRVEKKVEESKAGDWISGIGMGRDFVASQSAAYALGSG